MYGVKNISDFNDFDVLLMINSRKMSIIPLEVNPGQYFHRRCKCGLKILPKSDGSVVKSSFLDLSKFLIG
jgi:hypothetical protein